MEGFVAPVFGLDDICEKDVEGMDAIGAVMRYIACSCRALRVHKIRADRAEWLRVKRRDESNNRG